jgi:NADH:ubiquinone oxidoreductase subunit K
MSAGVSVFLILAGAILRFAVTWSPDNVNLQVIGVILMIGGAAGLVASVALMVMRNRNKRSAEVFEQRRYIEPPV